MLQLGAMVQFLSCINSDTRGYYTRQPKVHDMMAVEKHSSAKIDIRSIKETQHSQLKSDEGQSGENELYCTGHGAVLISLMKSGIVEVLLSKGKEYILVVNSDIVAATIDLLQESSEFSNTRLGGFVAWEHFHRGMLIRRMLHVVGFREFGINKVAMDL
ncbi:hypothetical protein FRX31_011561 [Thalictrum thalictroides]|uniref:UTP--glucose-1-phosphate uridylyltransferase n=1 Tax=Thalictrum thalictroides TaxID=46969 RepID=A0A7J6WRV5_THATH|nr:hypothetical protein FRX31_011561 [Thalictrum thalictroides]